MNIRFLKPIELHRKEGYPINAIISFAKLPYIQQDKKIVQYSYHLFIDLWIIKLQFDWLGKTLRI